MLTPISLHTMYTMDNTPLIKIYERKHNMLLAFSKIKMLLFYKKIVVNHGKRWHPIKERTFEINFDLNFGWFLCLTLRFTQEKTLFIDISNRYVVLVETQSIPSEAGTIIISMQLL